MTGRRLGVAIVALALLAPIPPARAASGENPFVTLTSPEPGAPLAGGVRMEAEVEAGAGIAEVRFLVDGEIVAILETPPWRILADLGHDPTSHRLEVVAVDGQGRTARAGFVSPAYRVDEEIDLSLRQVYVGVSGEVDRIGALEREDFRLFDGGEKMELVTWERGDVPLTALLLVDASESMGGDRLRAAVFGARAFVDSMEDLDQAALMLFSDRVRHSTPFTSVPEVLDAGLGVVHAGGGTSLNDHLYLALRRLEQRQGRRVLVVLSDGLDVTSVLPMEEVLELGRRLDVQVEWIRLAESGAVIGHLTAWRDAEDHARERRLLERLVEVTGGRIVDLPSIEAAAGAFTEVLRDLRSQVVLGYYPPTVDETEWRSLRVEAGVRGVELRAPEGYLAEPPDSPP